MELSKNDLSLRDRTLQENCLLRRYQFTQYNHQNEVLNHNMYKIIDLNISVCH